MSTVLRLSQLLMIIDNVIIDKLSIAALVLTFIKLFHK